jgi:hypothetical protein
VGQLSRGSLFRSAIIVESAVTLSNSLNGRLRSAFPRCALCPARKGRDAGGFFPCRL